MTAVRSTVLVLLLALVCSACGGSGPSTVQWPSSVVSKVANSCEQGGGTNAQCGCAVRYLEDHYDPSSFTKGNGQLALDKATKACKAGLGDSGTSGNSGNSGNTGDMGNRGAPTTTTTTLVAVPLPTSLPNSFQSPTMDTLISVEHCPLTAFESADFSALCSANGTGPGILLGYSVPAWDSIDISQNQAAAALLNAGFSTSNAPPANSNIDPVDGERSFTGLGYEGWFLSVFSKPNLFIYFQPLSS